MSKTKTCRAKNPQTCRYHNPTNPRGTEVQALIEAQYFTATQTTGTVNKTSLTPESYKSFGFAEPQQYDRFERPILSEIDFEEESEKELQNISRQDRHALYAYANLNNTHEWVNDALNLKQTRTLLRPHPTPYTSPFNTQWLQDVKDYLNEPNHHRTNKLLQDITTRLDKALHISTPNIQRMSYRATTTQDGYSETETKEYKLGDSIEFKGYQSTSASKEVATQFAAHNKPNHEGKQAVIFEIKAASGVNIAGLSSFSEREILLPRNTHLTVVGIHKNVTYGDKETNAVVDVIQVIETTPHPPNSGQPYQKTPTATTHPRTARNMGLTFFSEAYPC